MKAKTITVLCVCLCLTAVRAATAQTNPVPTGNAGARPAVPLDRHGTPRTDKPHNTSRPHRDHEHPGQQHDGEPNEKANARNALQFGPVGRWWDNKSVASTVGINRQQQQKMDSIFNSNRPAIVDSYKTFLKAQQNLEKLNKNPHPDQDKVFAAIDAVNQARSDLQKAASAMLLQIRSEMTPDQIEKLEQVQ